MGKSDRAFVFGLLAIAVGCGLPPHPWTFWIFPAIAILLAATIVNRVRRGLAELHPQ
jgi:CDP-diacylglycerol--glycerol-3-phosphate 3-phosphatidyltransferase